MQAYTLTFGVVFAGLTTVSFTGKAEFGCVSCSMPVCCLLQRACTIQACRMLCMHPYVLSPDLFPTWGFFS